MDFGSENFVADYHKFVIDPPPIQEGAVLRRSPGIIEGVIEPLRGVYASRGVGDHRSQKSFHIDMAGQLRRRYPLLFRKVFKKNSSIIFVTLAVWGVASYFILKYMPFTPAEGGQLIGRGHQIWFAWVGLLILFLGWQTGYEILYYFTYDYDMDEQNVVVRKGVIAKTEVTLPFNKITDVYVDQDMLDVVFGLWDLHISTPTVESGHLAHIDGLAKASAMELRDIVLERINKQSK